MADEDVPEGTPDIPADAEDGDGAADVANPSTSPEPMEEPMEEAVEEAVEEPMEEAVEEAVDVEEPLTPYRAAKMAGIVVGTVLLCAVVVVAAVWAITAIVDEDEDESWFEYVSPAALTADDDDDYDEYRRGYGKGPSADSNRWDWHGKDYFTKPDSWNDFWPEDDGCEMPFGFGANNRPVVIVVVPGVGLGAWGAGGGSGFDELGGGPRGLLPDIAPFFERESWFGGEEWPGEWGFEGFFEGFGSEALGEGFFGDPADLMKDFFDASNLEDPEWPSELSLEVTELDNTESHNEAPQVLESSVPT